MGNGLDQRHAAAAPAPRLMGAAAQLPGVAEALANGFDNPPDLFPWIADPAEADRFIAAGGRRKRVPAPAAQPALC